MLASDNRPSSSSRFATSASRSVTSFSNSRKLRRISVTESSMPERRRGSGLPRRTSASSPSNWPRSVRISRAASSCRLFVWLARREGAAEATRSICRDSSSDARLAGIRSPVTRSTTAPTSAKANSAATAPSTARPEMPKKARKRRPRTPRLFSTPVFPTARRGISCSSPPRSRNTTPVQKEGEMRHPFGAFMVATLVLVAPASGEVLIGVAPSLTGPVSQTGEIDKQTMEVAVADLNAKGGVLGEWLRTVLVDDQCDAGAAVLAAGKLVAERVTVVFGHICSGAAVPASEVYEAAGIPVFSNGAVEPKLTERGQRYVFRLSARTDREAALVADLMATRYADKPIAVVHETQMASLGLAAHVRSELDRKSTRLNSSHD